MEKYKLDDKEIINYNSKDIYNKIKEFIKQYYIYYQHMNKSQKEFIGNTIANNLIELDNLLCDMYFNKVNFSYNYMYNKVKKLEFNIRLLYQLEIVVKKQYICLSKIISELDQMLTYYIK